MPDFEFETWDGQTYMSIQGGPWLPVTLEWEVGKVMPDNESRSGLFQFSDCPGIPGLELRDISCERYRVYSFEDREYRIDSPIALYYRPGGSTHRIVDMDGESHCVPFPGKSTVIRWRNHDPSVPVNF